MRKTYNDYNIPMLACSIHFNLNYDKKFFQRYLQFKSNGLALYISESRLFQRVKFPREISHTFGRWCKLLLECW